MNKFHSICRLLICLCGLFSFSALANGKQPFNTFYAISLGTDHVGVGQIYHFDEHNGYIKAGPSFNRRGVGVVASGTSSWTLDFIPPNNQNLEVGKTYENVERAPFQKGDKPGMSIITSRRGCNELTGRFTVLELNKDNSDSVKSLAIDFQQICDDEGLLIGSIRYNSNIPPRLFPKQKIQVEMKSDEGEWVGDGKEYSFNSEGHLFMELIFGVNNSIAVHTDQFELDFSPPANQEWRVGKYKNVYRYAFAPPESPGMDIFGKGHGCNHVSGEFEVLEIEYDKLTKLINKLAINFEHHCEGFKPGIRGSIRYHSNIK